MLVRDCGSQEDNAGLMSSPTRSPLSKQSSPSLFIPNTDFSIFGVSTTMRCQLVPLTILGFRVNFGEFHGVQRICQECGDDARGIPENLLVH